MATGKNTFILGAGITGLTVASKSGLTVFEAEDAPGGICASYYMSPGTKARERHLSDSIAAYRFEIGGGHWIFGADKKILDLLKKFASIKRYARSSAVYFSRKDKYVPYPIQNNLRFLEKKLTSKILKEIQNLPEQSSPGLKQYLLNSFGPTLCKLFFYPFNGLYTAGLYKHIAAQETYKTPLDHNLIIRGADKQVPAVGYNAQFVYPQEGLDVLIKQMSKNCDIRYKKCVTRIDTKTKKIYFKDGSTQSYDALISTLPLNKVVEITGLEIDGGPPPYTSVLVLNIGATRGRKCPNEHWLYLPDSKCGFHRVGFYSNVDASFLPKTSKDANDRVSIYVERAYYGGKKPTRESRISYANSVIDQLKRWGFVDEIEVVDSNWIEVAYTWLWPYSSWREDSIQKLEQNNIYQIGRYGRWKFQGIADSIKEGVLCANRLCQ